MSDQERPIWAKRLGYVIQECFDFIGKSARHHREAVVVRGIPVRDGMHRVVYRYGVRGAVEPDDIDEELRDIFGRIRSVLDIAMFAAAKTAAQPPLTPRQERNTYFPIADSQEAWNSAAGQPHLKALTTAQLGALRAIQPFKTGNSVVSWFNDVHNKDKHERPLRLATVVDQEFVMVFAKLAPPVGSSEYWIDWVEPLPAVQNRVEFAEYRSVDPIRSAGIEDVPIALALWVGDQWCDIQHLLWDLMEFTTRACAILDDGDTGLADAMKDFFGHQRDQLAAFKKMMLTGDAAAEHAWLRLSGVEEEYASADWAPIPGLPHMHAPGDARGAFN